MIRTALSLAFLLASSAMALAESDNACSAVEGCACSAPVGTVGTLGNVSGTVFVTGRAGYTPVKASTEVALGDRITVRVGSSALLSFGAQCQVALNGPERMTVKRVGNCACAVSLSSGKALPSGVRAAGLLGGVALAGGIAALIAGQQNDQASP
jgi:hypothetical protein